MTILQNKSRSYPNICICTACKNMKIMVETVPGTKDIKFLMATVFTGLQILLFLEIFLVSFDVFFSTCISIPFTVPRMFPNVVKSCSDVKNKYLHFVLKY